MNYLGHFYVADLTHSSYAGALLGDFIKGRQWQNFPRSLQAGILYHRQLDQWIDRYIIDNRLTELFSPTVRRFAPIALDLYWDYCLANQWTLWHPQALSIFSENVYTQLASHQLPEKAQIVSQKMRDYDWLLFYQQDGFIERALGYISRRFSKKPPFTKLTEELWQQHANLEQFFPQLMQDLLAQFPAWKEQIVDQIWLLPHPSANDAHYL